MMTTPFLSSSLAHPISIRQTPATAVMASGMTLIPQGQQLYAANTAIFPIPMSVSQGHGGFLPTVSVQGMVGGTPAIYHSGLDRAQAAALLSQHNMSTRLLIAPATEISAMPVNTEEKYELKVSCIT
ncbi:hypothetical protein GBAR_LOCUS23644 [Geodia barretti]|uniref:Uncharacterized protein n=1 Tax=Geodia barretti TaxID=519541 RepID=A0AA35T7E9_GEOBA|nr:hypothetical protein GBAR_LOCUS23644 [Geodia barretti]